MSQVTRSQEGINSNDGGSESAQSVKRPRWKRFGLLLGTGCLSLLVCIAAGIAIVSYSGWLSGQPGNRNDMPVWSPDGNTIAFFSDRGGNPDPHLHFRSIYDSFRVHGKNIAGKRFSFRQQVQLRSPDPQLTAIYSLRTQLYSGYRCKILHEACKASLHPVVCIACEKRRCGCV